MTLRKDQIARIKSFLRDVVSPYAIYLFGSYANDTVRNESDIDIAYLSDKMLSDYERFMVAQELASQLKNEVDLIDLQKASTVFQVQIVSTGKVIYCSDDYKRQLFEMKVLKMYSRLNEERAVILQRIKEDGSIYGKS